MEGKGVVEVNFRVFYFRGKEKGEGNSFDRHDYQIITKLRNKLAGPVPEVPRTGPRMGYPGPIPTTRVSLPPFLFIFAMDTKI